jgi:predicted P-loop ATPase
MIELGELAAISKHDLAALKAFVTRRTDRYRPSYGRTAQDFPRRCVFAGTTNASAFLSDSTGNRRWWPVEVQGADLQGLDAARDQIWAEARARFQRGERWHVDSPELAALCEAEQDARYSGDPWEELTARYLDAWTRKPLDQRQLEPVAIPQILTSLGVETSKRSRSDENRVATILQRLGWTRGARVGDGSGGRLRTYAPPVNVQPAEGVGPGVGQLAPLENKPPSNLSNVSNLFLTHGKRSAGGRS